MRKVLLALVVVAAALLVAPTAEAAPPSFGWQMYQYNAPDQPVEQQSDYPYTPTAPHYVTNPFTCTWDVDDFQQWLALPAPLRAGQSVSMSACVVADATSYPVTINGVTAQWSSTHGAFGTAVSGDGPGLAVQVCWQPQGWCVSPPVTQQSDGSWESWSCSQAAYNPDDPALVPIPDSGTGGTGVVSTITVAVTNTSAKTIRNVSSDVQVVGISQWPWNHTSTSGCVADSWTNAQVRQYPMRWTTG